VFTLQKCDFFIYFLTLVGNEKRGKTCSKGRQGRESNLQQLRRGLRPPYVGCA
uniref:Uncharacterized protein n=1 Tax=Poecilia mexicana TaxID=48701 RepID=A0A3B3XM97_9TELE